MDREQLAIARTHAYALLARLMVRGMDESLLEQVRAVPALASVLPEEVDLDELAAAHHRRFRFEAFPHAGVYLDPEGLAGGEAADRSRTTYRSAGFHPKLDDLAADHLGVQLSFLSFLCGAEADALEDGELEAAGRIAELQRRFLDEHLLRWLPALVATIDGTERDLWRQVVVMASELAADHRASYAGAANEAAPWRLPEAPRLLDDPETDLRTIVEFLLAPAHAGLFLGRNDLAVLGRKHELPRGFGSRRIILTNLFKSAVEFEQVPELMASLTMAIQDRAASLNRQLDDAPALAPSIEPWIRRLGDTARIAHRIARAPRIALEDMAEALEERIRQRPAMG